MNNSDDVPSRSDTVNGRRYKSANARVYLNPDGLPVAFRRVQVLQRGAFAGASRLQIVTPKKVASVSQSQFNACRDHCTPLN